MHILQEVEVRSFTRLVMYNLPVKGLLTLFRPECVIALFFLTTLVYY